MSTSITIKDSTVGIVNCQCGKNCDERRAAARPLVTTMDELARLQREWRDTCEPYDPTKCRECGGDFVRMAPGQSSTLVGYSTGDCGRPHDDNCTHRAYYCADGHASAVSIQKRCPCGWVGKERCYACNDVKVKEWPKVAND